MAKRSQVDSTNSCLERWSNICSVSSAVGSNILPHRFIKKRMEKKRNLSTSPHDSRKKADSLGCDTQSSPRQQACQTPCHCVLQHQPLTWSKIAAACPAPLSLSFSLSLSLPDRRPLASIERGLPWINRRAPAGTVIGYRWCCCCISIFRVPLSPPPSLSPHRMLPRVSVCLEMWDRSTPAGARSLYTCVTRVAAVVLDIPRTMERRLRGHPSTWMLIVWSTLSHRKLYDYDGYAVLTDYGIRREA